MLGSVWSCLRRYSLWPWWLSGSSSYSSSSLPGQQHTYSIWTLSLSGKQHMFILSPWQEIGQFTRMHTSQGSAFLSATGTTPAASQRAASVYVCVFKSRFKPFRTWLFSVWLNSLTSQWSLWVLYWGQVRLREIKNDNIRLWSQQGNVNKGPSHWVLY